MKVVTVVGARPQFIKAAPVSHALRQVATEVLVHTGQHFDANMSDVFFEELAIPAPDYHLGVGGGSHGAMTGAMLAGIEQVLLKEQPDWVMVYGDTNSTLAGALAASKLHLPVAHVEAGLRSFDRSMPEEINRIVTDSLSDMLLVSEPVGAENLRQEGHSSDRIHLVGNVMIDTLLEQVKEARSRSLLANLGLQSGSYCVVTLHRPANVDDKVVLTGLMRVLAQCSERIPIVFPIHPRTRARMEAFGLLGGNDQPANIQFLDPLGYNDFLCLTSQAKVVITDSGGLQEESTALGVPCLTMRPNTERPITVTEGTSVLCGSDPDKLRLHLSEVETGRYKQGECPALWDGRAAIRIAACLAGISDEACYV